LEPIDASVLIFDIRNFTDTLRDFEAIDDDSFLLFVQDICSCGYNIYFQLSPCNNIYFNTTGDGFLVIFGGENHYLTCYLYGIVFNIIASEKVLAFNKNKDINLSYGIGMESGMVKKIIISTKPRDLYTYIGNVINIASRIEAENKNHARANMIIGGQINQLLVKKLYGIDYFLLMEEVKKSNSTEEITTLIDKMNRINQELLLSYIFEHNLKGVDKPMPLFRLSPSLLRQERKTYNTVVKNLSQIIDREEYIKSLINMEETNG